MAAVRTWFAWDVRRRWVSLVVLAVLTAFATGTVLTATAGAHRGYTALQRLRDRTLPVDALIVANLPGLDWRPVDSLPYVTASSRFVLAADGHFREGTEVDEATDFLHDDATWMRGIEKPVITQGRMLDFDDPLEAVVTPAVVEHGYGVGDVLHYRLPTPEQADSGNTDTMSYADLKGPDLAIRIVGVAVLPWAQQNGADAPDIELSPAIMKDYRANILGARNKAGWENDAVRLRHGAADIPRLREDLKRITGKAIDVWNYEELYDSFQTTNTREAGFLLAFALAALLASILLVGQAVARAVAGSAGELDRARPLGMTPRSVVTAAVLAPVLACSAGALLGTCVAGYASRWFPIGAAANAEPDPGVRIDWLVLSLGLLGTLAVIGAGAVASALLAVRRRADAPAGTSTVTRVATNLNAPVPVTAGLRFALEKGRGRTAVPVRPALVGAIVGVLGVVAVGVFSRGINDATSNPDRFGQTYQAMGFIGYNGHDFLPSAQMGAALASLPQVTGVDDARGQVADFPHGSGSVQLWSWDPGDKPLGTTILQGRMPETPNEVALGYREFLRQHLTVGDHVRLTSGRRTENVTVVGEALLPEGPHNQYDEGGWITRAGYDRLFHDYKFHVFFVALTTRARSAAGMRQLNDDLLAKLPTVKKLVDRQCQGNPDPSCRAMVSGLSDLDVRTNGTVSSLKETQHLPYFLAGFLILLAIGAIAHALVTAVRRRVVDLAVLRAVGMTPGQSRTIVIVQACTLAVVGLVFGLPLGIALGRTAWRWIATHFPLQYVAPGDLLLILATIPAAVVLVNLLAAVPARRAARARVAAVLRAE